MYNIQKQVYASKVARFAKKKDKHCPSVTCLQRFRVLVGRAQHDDLLARTSVSHQ